MLLQSDLRGAAAVHSALGRSWAHKCILYVTKLLDHDRRSLSTSAVRVVLVFILNHSASSPDRKQHVV